MHCNDRDNLVEQLSVELGRGKRQPFEKVVEIMNSPMGLTQKPPRPGPSCRVFKNGKTE